MANDRTHVEEALPAYALDALDAGERALVADHLAECDRCSRIVEEYRALAGLLPYGLPLETPSRGARAALLARARSGRGARASAGRRVADGLWAAFRPLRWAAVGAVVVALALWNARLQWSDGDTPQAVTPPVSAPDGRVIPLAGSAVAPESRAHLLLASDGQSGWLTVTGLPVRSAGEGYQLWFVRPDQSRASGGVFQVDARGAAVLVVTVPGPLDQFIRAGVTEEPEGGSPAPTGRNVLGGPL